MNKCLMAAWNKAHFQAGRHRAQGAWGCWGWDGVFGENLLEESLVCGEAAGLE